MFYKLHGLSPNMSSTFLLKNVDSFQIFDKFFIGHFHQGNKVVFVHQKLSRIRMGHRHFQTVCTSYCQNDLASFAQRQTGISKSAFNTVTKKSNLFS